MREPPLPELIARLEEMDKPSSAALHGAALGGGFEAAPGCTFRVALHDARVGLPSLDCSPALAARIARPILGRRRRLTGWKWWHDGRSRRTESALCTSRHCQVVKSINRREATRAVSQPNATIFYSFS